MILMKLLFGCISLIVAGVFGWLFVGKIRQSVFVARSLRDSALLTDFIKSYGIDKIAAEGIRIPRKGHSFRNNLDDVVFINSFASRNLKLLYGVLAALGIVCGILSSKYFFWSDLATMIIVAFLKMPVQFALQASREIFQMIVILYRLHQAEPAEYHNLISDVPGLKCIDIALSNVIGKQ
jgi:hypothetical protein